MRKIIGKATVSKFPAQIPLPESIHKSRSQRLKEMISTARRGVMMRFSIIVAELIGYFYFNSSALLLDAISSLMDIGASLFLILCVKLADKPPDRHHPFGHGRFEPLGGLQLGLLLVVVGGGLLFQQVSQAVHESKGHIIDARTWIIPFAAMIVLEISYRHLKRTAKRENSPALLADAVHYRIDGINSLFATIALLFAAYFPAHSGLIDHVGAIFIAALMIGIGCHAARNNLNQVLDRTPDESYFHKVRQAARAVKGVRATEKLQIQVYGPDAHVNIDIEVDPLLSVDEAHEITQRVRAEIQKEWPAVRDVIVHVEPFYPGDHIEN